VVLGPRPPELEALLKRRHALGQDLYDELWAGDYHMVPVPHPSHGYFEHQVKGLLYPVVQRAGLFGSSPFNLGTQDDYRVPDGGIHRVQPSTTFVPTAAVVIEVMSPDDETWAKIDFYASRSVDELLLVDSLKHSLTWLVLEGGHYTERDSSRLLDVSSADLAGQIDWPAVS